MLTSNPFSHLTIFLPPIAIQACIVLMILTVITCCIVTR